MYLTLESVLIVLSVFLAFGLNEWRSQRAERARAASVLTSFKHEIESNLERIEASRPRHARLAEAIAARTAEGVGERAAISVVTEARTGDGPVILMPAEAAWQTATSTGALGLLDYETAAIISRVYFGQLDQFGQTAGRLTDLAFDARMYDSDTAAESLEIFGALMDNLVVQEASLIDEYRLALAHLEELGI
ncbi:MAG: hypothetical protein ACLF0P_02885 [Thermoanaerobaculia bacterium]